MIRRFLAVILAMLLLTFAPGRLVAPPATPPPAGTTTEAPVIRSPVDIWAGSGATPGAGVPAGTAVVATDPVLLLPAPAGPFPAGAAGTLAVVAVLPDTAGQSVLVVLRNATGQTLGGATVTAIAAGPTGPIGGATDQLTPARVVPGGLAFAQVTLDVPPGIITATTLPTVSVFGAAPTSDGPPIDLAGLTLSSDPGQATVRLARAPSTGPVTTYRVVTVCFARDETGAASAVAWAVTGAAPTPTVGYSVLPSIGAALPSTCGADVVLGAEPSTP